MQTEGLQFLVSQKMHSNRPVGCMLPASYRLPVAPGVGTKIGGET